MVKPRAVVGQSYSERSRGRNIGGGPGLLSLFANGENGFLFDGMSDLSKLFTTNFGPTIIAANNDPVGLALDRSKWAGKTLEATLAEQSELLVPGSWLMSVAGGTATATDSPTGTLNLAGDGSNAGRGDQSFTTVIGKTYSLVSTVATNPISLSFGVTQGGSTVQNIGVVGVGTTSRYFFIATATTTWVRFQRTSTGPAAVISAISCKELIGNHAYVATAGLRPLWKANSNKPYLFVDGVDDRLLSPVIIDTAVTMAFAGLFVTTGASQVVIGGGVSGSNNRVHLGIASTGKGGMGWGTDTISGASFSTPDVITDVNHVLLATADATSRELWLDGVLVAQGASTGSGGGVGGGLALGALNNNGTYSAFMSGNIHAALALNRRVNAAEIAMISSQFQVRL